MPDWKSYINIVEPGTFMVPLDSMFIVAVNDFPVMAVMCPSMARKFAVLLDTARTERSKHNAMQILTEQLGLCAEHAEDILDALHTGKTPAANHQGSRSIN